MKLKFFLFLTLGTFLVTLIACTDESDRSLLDDGNDFVSERSINNLSISYEMTTDQIIEPTTGTLEDLCAIDVRLIAVPSSTTTVSTTFDQSGRPCIEMQEKLNTRDRNGGKGNSYSTTKLCDGVLTQTAPDGSTTTVQVDYDVKFFQTIAQSYYYTEIQKDSAMNVMILEAQNNGATTTINGNALTITEVDEDGNTTTTVYDMKNHVMISSQTTDPSGNLISKTILTYECKPDGTIIPKFIANYDYKENMICSDPVFTVEQISFNDFRVTL